MKYTKLSSTDIQVSRIGMGTYQFDPSWGQMTEKETIKIMHYGFDKGINYFNSALYYGEGQCEVLLGKAVQSLPRDKVVVATKLGFTLEGTRNLSKKHIREEAESKLKRMGLEYIDILLFHIPDPDTPIEESMEEMIKLQENGLIRYVGLSNYSVDLIQEVQKYGDVVVCEFYHSLLTQKQNRDVLAYCADNNIVATPFKVIERGLLTDKFSVESKDLPAFDERYPTDFVKEDHLDETEAFLDTLKVLAKEKDCTLAQLVIAWSLHQRGVACPLIGMRNTSEIDENIQAVDVVLSEEDLQSIQSIRNSYLY